MELKVLIAESSDILRRGLRTIFDDGQNGVQIYEAATKEALQTQLRSKQLDFIVVNQALITDMTILPYGQFILLTTEFDIDILQQAYRCGARGYFLEKTSAELLRSALWAEKGSILLEPTLASSLMDYAISGLHVPVQEKLLSPREREIVDLLRHGIDRRTIAKTLCISETTINTHIQRIRRKKYKSSNLKLL